MYRFGEWVGARHAATFVDGADDDVAYCLLAGALHQDRAGFGNVDLLVWEPYIDPRFAVLWESPIATGSSALLGRHRPNVMPVAPRPVGQQSRSRGQFASV
ncbi:MAG: hypothetical protein ACR2H2_08475 [Solirubrobacteraceae bacterium]